MSTKNDKMVKELKQDKETLERMKADLEKMKAELEKEKASLVVETDNLFVEKEDEPLYPQDVKVASANETTKVDETVIPDEALLLRTECNELVGSLAADFSFKKMFKCLSLIRKYKKVIKQNADDNSKKHNSFGNESNNKL